MRPRSRRAARGFKDQDRELTSRLSARIADLETRVMLLEARVRRDLPKLQPSRSSKSAKPVRPERRCPGCLLELPAGRKGATCVWCGFVFAAAERPYRPIARVRSRRVKRAAKGAAKRS
jgi:hypothetical protein